MPARSRPVLLYIDEEMGDMHNLSGSVDQPLAQIPYEDLNPGSEDADQDHEPLPLALSSDTVLRGALVFSCIGLQIRFFGPSQFFSRNA